MTDFKAVLFDLDGTLLDTLTDLAESMNAVLTRLGLPSHPKDAYRYFVGSGVEILARRALPEANRTPDMVHRCAEAMRTEYQGRWAECTRPYAGVPELLDALAGRGISLTILSNKPDDFTRLAVNHFLPGWPWSVVRGERSGTPRKPDPAGAFAIAGQLGIEPQRFLYLGDTDIDMQTAIAAGMYPVGALWGFRTQLELAEAGARTLVQHPLDLLNRLDGNG